MTTDHADEARKRHAAMYPKKPATRRGATPESKVKTEVEKYLKRIGALSLRTGAGLASFGERKVAIGRAGASDITALIEGGYWLSVECKAPGGVLSDLQRRYGEQVTARGGLFVVARSAGDVRAALVARFGEATVKGWEETDGRTRQR